MHLDRPDVLVSGVSQRSACLLHYYLCRLQELPLLCLPDAHVLLAGPVHTFPYRNKYAFKYKYKNMFHNILVRIVKL